MAEQRGAVPSVLAAHRSELDVHSARSLLLFGSIVRNEATSGSDVDLIVEFDRAAGFFALTRLQLDLERWLERPGDLSTADALRPEMRDPVLREALRAV